MMGWITRFIDKCRKTTFESGPPVPRQVDAGEQAIFKLIQIQAFGGMKTLPKGLKDLNVFKDEICLFRVKTRLCNKSDTVDFKTPILLPNSRTGVEQLIRQIHMENNHAGIQTTVGILREQVVIIQTKRDVRKVIRKCVTCRRFNTKPAEVIPAPLPYNQVKDAKTFQVTGVDFAGILILKNGDKVWIVIFTCAIYRGVHLEKVDCINTEDFLMAFNRFVSRRGRP